MGSVEVIDSKQKEPMYIFTELGREKRCKHCGEYWPVDSEFWFMVKAKLKSGAVVYRPDSACKACYDRVYRPNHVKGVNKISSSYERTIKDNRDSGFSEVV